MFSLLFLALLWLSHGFMHVEVKPDQKRCIGQELDEEDYAVFSMSAVHAKRDTSHTKQSLIATVEDPSGSVLIVAKIKLGGNTREEQISISERGVYNLCFELKDGKYL
jgi:hypothetical protein